MFCLCLCLLGSSSPPIIPVRGTWLQISPSFSNIVRSNIYPVPNPSFPFLGIHLTPHPKSGTILIGPNASLATAREVIKTEQKHILLHVTPQPAYLIF